MTIKQIPMLEQDDELKAVMEVLENQYAQLCHIFKEFNVLFAGGSELIQHMNDTAPVFFSLIQNLMIEALVVRFSRITDPAESGQNSSISLQRILCAVPKDKSQCREELASLIQQAENQVKPLRKWRDKDLVHLDLKRIKLGDSFQNNMSLMSVQNCLNAIHAVLNRTSTIFWDTEFDSDVLLTGGTAVSLIRTLENSRTAR